MHIDITEPRFSSPDLLPNGHPPPSNDTDQAGTGPAELPAPGQHTRVGTDTPSWLDEHGDMVLRTIHPHDSAALDQSGLPEYSNLDPGGERQTRTVGHALRNAGHSRAPRAGAGDADERSKNEHEDQGHGGQPRPGGATRGDRR